VDESGGSPRRENHLLAAPDPLKTIDAMKMFDQIGLGDNFKETLSSELER
jgi:hypothetical protein